VTRETVLARTMVELADNLVDDFDVVELLTTLADRCVEVLDVDAAGIMLAGPDRQLHLMASSSEAMRLVELFELQSHQGPCQDCFRTGRPVVNRDLTGDDPRWPRFATIAIVQHRTAVDAQVLNEQLTEALTSRIVIEQAKGMTGERRHLPMDEAFTLLRHHARRNNLRLADVARSIVDGTIDPDTLDAPTH
jgi:hypothetical protein